MASVGGVSCDFVRGNAAGQKEHVEVWRVPGLDGYGAFKTGQGDAPFRFTCVKYGTSSAVTTWIGSVEGLQGTIVTVVDDWAASHANCLITSVSVAQRAAELGNGGCRGELVVEGVVTE